MVESLAERLAQGDAQAWTTLYETYKRSVVGLCLGYLHHREEALDAAEETFLKAFRNSSTIKANGNLRAWLYTTAANTCKDVLRKRERGRLWFKKWLGGRRDELCEPSPEQEVEAEERQDRVRRALATLDERHRIPLVLRYYDHMDYDDIASVLSELEGALVKRGTVASRLSRAKRLLKSALEGEQR